MSVGKVYLVGAGPGDPGLLTVRGAELLRRAQVIVYDGLANAALLELAPDGAERIYAGKKLGDAKRQDEIEDVLVAKAKEGKLVVRLKGGDPFVFGRGGEEAERLVAEGIPFEVVPGVSAVSAVPAYAGIPLTHRDAAASAIAIATGHDSDEGRGVDWGAVAKMDTIVLFMAVRTLADVAARLVAAGRAEDTPAAAIRWGTTPAQRVVVATLGTLARAVAEAELKPPALVVVGDVVRYREKLAWFERRPLHGARVLVPRPREQARAFCDALRERGADPIVVETIRIVQNDAGPLEAALERRDFAWIALTSANAVEALFTALARLGKDARALAGARLAAVGEATASALAARGLVADVVPEDKTGIGLAEVLPKGVRVLLPRAQDGRDELLRALGDDAIAVDSYRTQPIPSEELAPRLALDWDVLTFFSPSQVDAVCAAAPAARLNRARLIAVIGPTTAAAAQAKGLRVDLIARRPNGDLLAEAIAERYHKEP